MCGRTCLTLQPTEIQCACKYKNPQDEETKIPDWRPEHNFGKKYTPSHNVAPADVTPVLVSADHFECEDETQRRVIVPMLWGMIPFWHKGDYRKHGLSTNNCRLEHMLESKLYRGPFRKGQRCVILCEGFYEWQTTKSSKPSERAAYYLYMPQVSDVKIYEKSTWRPDNINLLKLAGLFDVWQNDDGEKIFSYSVITFEANSLTAWLHHRQPAILETEEQVNKWLDFKNVPDKEALALLQSPKNLSWHQVSNIVNNSRHKSEQCNKPITEAKNSTRWQPKSKIMQSWLNIRKRKEEKIKLERPLSDDERDLDNEAKRQKFNSCGKSGSETTTEAEN